MKEHDISKLPQWAQDRIALAEMRQKEAEKNLKAAFPGNADTDTSWRVSNEFGGGDLPLPKGAIVSFKLCTEVVEARVIGDYLSIYSSLGGLLISPQANNAFYISFAKEE